MAAKKVSPQIEWYLRRRCFPKADARLEMDHPGRIGVFVEVQKRCLRTLKAICLVPAGLSFGTLIDHMNKKYGSGDDYNQNHIMYACKRLQRSGVIFLTPDGKWKAIARAVAVFTNLKHKNRN